MQPLTNSWLPNQVNTGPWLTHYTLNELESRIQTGRVTLPFCSLGTPHDAIVRTGRLLLPPLYQEELDTELLHE